MVFCAAFTTCDLLPVWMASSKWWCSFFFLNKVFICSGVRQGRNLSTICQIDWQLHSALSVSRLKYSNSFYLWLSLATQSTSWRWWKWPITAMRHRVTLIYTNRSLPLWLLLNHVNVEANVSGSQTKKDWSNLHAHFHTNNPTLRYSFLWTICTFGVTMQFWGSEGGGLGIVKKHVFFGLMITSPWGLIGRPLGHSEEWWSAELSVMWCQLIWVEHIL